MRVLRLLTVLAATAALAVGCSMARFGYDALPTWVNWQANRYLDLDAQQRAIVERHLDEVLLWHRQTQLPEYGAFLRAVDDRVRTGLDPADLGAWRAELGGAWTALAERLAPGVAELGVQLRPEQLDRLRMRLAQADDKLRAEWLPADGRSREEARVERLQRRASFFLGRLSAEQARRVAALAAAMPPTEEAWLAERAARNARLLQLLERLSRERPEPAQALRITRAGLLELWTRPGTQTAQGVARSVDAGDVFAVQVLALATPRQRAHLSELLTGYAKDFEALAARAQPQPPVRQAAAGAG